MNEKEVRPLGRTFYYPALHLNPYHNPLPLNTDKNLTMDRNPARRSPSSPETGEEGVGDDEGSYSTRTASI